LLINHHIPEENWQKGRGQMEKGELNIKMGPGALQPLPDYCGLDVVCP
jgi:hypothetical protein